MAELSPTAKVLQDEVQKLISLNFGDGLLLPYNVIIGHPTFSIKVSTDVADIVQSLSERYNVNQDAAARCEHLSIRKADLLDATYLLTSTESIILLKPSGKHKVFFGSFNKRTLRVLAGSLGDYDKKYQRKDGLLLTYIDNQIISLFLKQRAGSLIVHANVLVKNQVVLVLIGYSGVGKTTTSYHLVDKAGFQLFSDDLLVIDLNTGIFHQGPKKPKIKKSMGQLFDNCLGSELDVSNKQVYVFFLEKSSDEPFVRQLPLQMASEKFIEHALAPPETGLHSLLKASLFLLHASTNYEMKFNRHNKIEELILSVVNDV